MRDIILFETEEVPAPPLYGPDLDRWSGYYVLTKNKGGSIIYLIYRYKEFDRSGRTDNYKIAAYKSKDGTLLAPDYFTKRRFSSVPVTRTFYSAYDAMCYLYRDRYSDRNCGFIATNSYFDVAEYIGVGSDQLPFEALNPDYIDCCADCCTDCCLQNYMEE